MDLGFETIGNATLICHDGGPLLATDPWIQGSAYFGSWIHTHSIPAEQRQNVLAARYIWLSHGHPDHLSFESMELLRDKPILIGDHAGSRIANGLRKDGFEVRVLETGKWTRLSDRVRVLCVPDYSQDSILLIDFDGQLVIDSNDAGDRGVGEMLAKEITRYENSWLACLTGFGDADMINFFDEDGRRIPPAAAAKAPVGPGILEILSQYGIKTFVPSSSMHKYQRADSVWANEYTTPVESHGDGFASDVHEILPAFIRFDLTKHEYTRIDPPENPDLSLPPETFGDNWSDELEPADQQALRTYFRRFEHLFDHIGFVRFRVGGKDTTIDIAPAEHDLGVTFETPRGSLMECIRHEIFDDVLIGNFMKTTLHGPWERQGALGLYPHFTPFVTKYGDNGRAVTKDELRRYFAFYEEKGFSGPGPGVESRLTWQSLSPYRTDPVP